MKKLCLPVLGILFFVSPQLSGQGQWNVVPGKITTPWATNVNQQQPLPEYPRPQLVRKEWQNLNGLWDYAIVDKNQNAIPKTFDGKILVPYPIESALSGVGKKVGKDNFLWYRKNFQIEKNLKNKKLILHFGAVDWQTAIFINGKQAGTHEGGYDPFSFDITPYLKKGRTQEIAIRVWDPTDAGPQPRGKQVSNPEGIWYTSVTGIWQTVWIEEVPTTYIISTKQTPDIDNHVLNIETFIEESLPGDQINVIALKKGIVAAKSTGNADGNIQLKIPDPVFWSPGNPFLYDLKIQIIRKGKVIDEAASYFAFRKISMEKDNKGIQRMMLNHQFVFQFGPLDQGWWPDGLYTAPTEEATLNDLVKTKGMGFNMIRKHVKVEPARWYHDCDSLGILVWQDMPSGDLGDNAWNSHPGIISGKNLDKNRSPESEAIYRKEWKAIIDALYNFPCIVVWVPFNEAWGEFKTREITAWTKNYDPSRLVNSASGGNFLQTGDILDIHNYPDPEMPTPAIFGSKQILVLGEFGGLGLPIEGHTWMQKGNWGYQSFKNADELRKRYSELIQNLNNLIPLGLSAAVYTQTTDVENEINGLMTYDRKVIKMGEKEIHDINQKLYQHKIQ